jgi:hypothetical protein
MIMKHNYIAASGDTIKLSERDPNFPEPGISKKEGKKQMKKSLAFDHLAILHDARKLLDQRHDG